MEGQTFSHKKGNSRERDWLESERSGESGLSFLRRWEGNPHGMAFHGSSFPLVGSFSPVPSPTPSSSSSRHTASPSTAFCPGPAPGHCDTQPLCSLRGKDSLHHARKELPTLDQTTHRGHDLPKISSISRKVAKLPCSCGPCPLPCRGVDGDSELTFRQEA